MIEYIFEALPHLKELLLGLIGRHEESTENLREAINAVESAAVATRSYLADIENDRNNASRERERELSEKWLDARQKLIEAGEYELADLCLNKAEGWADPRLWNSPRFQEVPLGLDSIIDASRSLTRKLSGGHV